MAEGTVVLIGKLADKNAGGFRLLDHHDVETTSAAGAGVSMKQSIMLTAAGGKPTTTAGCAAAQVVEAGTNDIDTWVCDFDATTKEYAFWNVPMPSNWDASTLTYKVYWTTSSSTSTHTAVFGLAALARGDAETIDTAYGTAIEVSDDATATANQVLISAESAALTVGGTAAAGDYVVFRLYRDPANGSDDLNVDARVLAVRILYGVTALSA